MSDVHELHDQEQIEPKDRTGRTVNILIASAFGAVATLAIIAIVLCVHIMRENAKDGEVRLCVRRIDLFVADIRDEINTQGWDSLVTKAEGSPNVDVRVIAAEMRTRITQLKSPETRDMRNQANAICEADAHFEPR